MLERKIASLALLLAVSGGSVQAQDLSVYDPNNYSGGYAEGSYGPMGHEQLYPYDSQDQWQHGYIQYMPFYGAYEHFRPYNYKDVSAQVQTAAGWGMSPRMPYSQQFWHRYQAHAKMGHPASGAYESHLNVPVPKRMPSQPLDPEIEELGPAPQPVNPPGLGAPMSPNSVQWTPAPSHTGASYQQRTAPSAPAQGRYLIPQPVPGQVHGNRGPGYPQQAAMHPGYGHPAGVIPGQMTPQMQQPLPPQRQQWTPPQEQPAPQIHSSQQPILLVP